MLNNKKIAMGLICAGIVAIIAGIIVVITHPSEYSTSVSKALDEAVARSTFTRASVSMSDTTIDGKNYRYAAVTDTEFYNNSECIGEGHLILGSKEKDGTVDSSVLRKQTAANTYIKKPTKQQTAVNTFCLLKRCSRRHLRKRRYPYRATMRFGHH